MNEIEYHKKREALAVSHAPAVDIALAIAELDAQYNVTGAVQLAQDQFHESRADLPTGGE